MVMPGKIANPELYENGKQSFQLAAGRMGIIEKIVKKAKRQPLSGLRLGICLHITKETTVLAMAAKKLGAEIAICSANPLSAQDDIAAFLFGEGVSVYAWRGETRREYSDCIKQVVRFAPHIVTDDGGDLHAEIHRQSTKGIRGGTEETTSGVRRLLSLERSGNLAYPVIAVNNARTKYLFDNRHGTGQSTIDGILRATAAFLPGTRMVVCGYGWVGKGVAERARGMGAIVTVTEVDPVRALEAHMDGFQVCPLDEAATHGEIFVTCTGQTGVIRQEHFKKMRDGAILANAGHFDVEIDVSYLRRASRPVKVRQNVERFDISGKKIYLISEGRVANLVAAEGHPPEVMALSFGNQLLSIMHVAKHFATMQRHVYDVPEEIDLDVARAALKASGISIDSPTDEQKRYS